VQCLKHPGAQIDYSDLVDAPLYHSKHRFTRTSTAVFFWLRLQAVNRGASPNVYVSLGQKVRNTEERMYTLPAPCTDVSAKHNLSTEEE
jgi:hypothetical protein